MVLKACELTHADFQDERSRRIGRMVLKVHARGKHRLLRGTAPATMLSVRRPHAKWSVSKLRIAIDVARGLFSQLDQGGYAIPFFLWALGGVVPIVSQKVERRLRPPSASTGQ